MSELNVGYHCQQCETEFTKEKGYFVKDDEILCNCCIDNCHYLSEDDVERALRREAEKTDSGIWLRHIKCRYCDRDLSIEFSMDDEGYDNENKKGHISIILGSAE